MGLELPTREEFVEQINEIRELFIEKWKTIIPLSISIDVALSYVIMFFWQIIYVFTQSEWTLNQLIKATFSIDNILPYFSGFLIEPEIKIIQVVLVCLIATIFLYLKEKT